jgi:hypothetical protein
MVADAERPREEQVALAQGLTRIYHLAQEAQIALPEMALRYLQSDAGITSVIPECDQPPRFGPTLMLG